MKKLNLNKYSFLYYTKGDFFCWINNDENFLKLASKDEYLKNLTLWRYKLKIEKKIDDFEKPSTILDGEETSKYSKIYYRKKYPHLKFLDLQDTNIVDSWEKTKRYLLEKDNFIIFEATFNYNGFFIKTDILIKENNKLSLIEVKAVTTPLYYHAVDIMFQYKIITSLGYKLSKKNLKLLTLNNAYVYFKDATIEDSILTLFMEWEHYFNSRTSSSGDYISEIISKEEYFQFFDFFDETLKKIKKIQLQDNPPVSSFEERNFRGMNSDYEDYYLKIKDAGGNNSVFNFSGDSWFSKWKKAKYFEEGYKTIDSVNNLQIISKSAVKNMKEETMDWIAKDPQLLFDSSLSNNIKTDLFKNAKLLKRLIQRDSLINNKNFILDEKISFFLKQFKKVIYMFDFETVQNAIPKIYGTSPYEQVPYQYSMHIILDKDDFDFKTMRNVVHLEWLAKEKDFYNDFWKNFLRDIQIYGDGSYVSFNKSFENMIIQKRIEKMIYGDETDFLRKLKDETLDLMIPFANKWYYDNDFHGRYSIKVIAPHFAPELNYKELDDRVQKGDQSAKQCKLWLLNSNAVEGDKMWKEVREAMLKYCMYDTLSMVVIFQRLKERVNLTLGNLIKEELGETLYE